MPILFISDLHVDKHSPKTIQSFIHVLNMAKDSADKVYILGDLFERWIGDDDEATYLAPVYTALKNCSLRMPVYMIVGNRDFLLGNAFALKTGVRFLSDPSVIEVYGEKIICLHGDTLCTDDIAYQTYRQKVRNPATIRRFLRLPLWLRRCIGNLLRILSQHQQKKQNLSILDANPETIQQLMRKYQVTRLIHGHTHRPGIHYTLTEGSIQSWIVLGDWHEDNYSALWLYEDGRYELVCGTLPPILHRADVEAGHL